MAQKLRATTELLTLDIELMKIAEVRATTSLEPKMSCAKHRLWDREQGLGQPRGCLGKRGLNDCRCQKQQD